MVKYILEQDERNHLRGVVLLGGDENRSSPAGALGIVAMIAGIHPLCEDMGDMETKLKLGHKPSYDCIELTVRWR